MVDQKNVKNHAPHLCRSAPPHLYHNTPSMCIANTFWKAPSDHKELRPKKLKTYVQGALKGTNLRGQKPSPNADFR